MASSCQKVYGYDHPDVATDANNIGQILRAQVDLAGALRYTQRALHIFQATYGPDNPQTEVVSRNLARIEQALAKRSEGTPLEAE
jgi:hypothetical protein